MPHTHFKLYSCPQLFNLTISYRTSNFSNTSETIVVGAYTQPTECRGERSKKKEANRKRFQFQTLLSAAVFVANIYTEIKH